MLKSAHVILGTPELPLYELAHPILGAELGRTANSYRGSTWAGTLQLNVGSLEALSRRDSGTGIFRQGWAVVVPPCVGRCD